MSKIGLKHLNKAELCDVLSKLSFDFVFLERVDDIRIEKFVFDNKKAAFTLPDRSESAISDWHKVTAFSNEYEFRCDKKGDDSYNAIFLTDDNAKFPENWNENERDISDFEHREYDVFLWGGYEKTVKCWIEGRIPRFLHYPLDPKESPSPRLKVKKYYRVYWDDDRIKEERYYRFITLH